MGQVTSLTAEAIAEMTASWNAVADRQTEVEGRVLTAEQQIAQKVAEFVVLSEQVLPGLLQQLTENSQLVTELNDTTLVDLAQRLAQNESSLEDLNTVTLPALQTDLASGIVNSLSQPRIFFADAAPVNPDPPIDPNEDPEERQLQIDDVWYDTSDGYKRYRWTGLAWEPFEPSISGLAEQIRGAMSPDHAIFPDSGGTETTLGANITAA